MASGVLGLGQVLRYRQRLARLGHSHVVAVLVPRRDSRLALPILPPIGHVTGGTMRRMVDRRDHLDANRARMPLIRLAKEVPTRMAELSQPKELRTLFR